MLWKIRKIAIFGSRSFCLKGKNKHFVKNVHTAQPSKWRIFLKKALISALRLCNHVYTLFITPKPLLWLSLHYFSIQTVKLAVPLNLEVSWKKEEEEIMHIIFEEICFLLTSAYRKKVLLLKIGDSCCTFGFSDVDLGRFSAKNVKNCFRRLLGLVYACRHSIYSRAYITWVEQKLLL